MIQSSSNDLYRLILSLLSSKGIKKEMLFLLSGEKLIREFLKKPNLKIRNEIFTDKMPRLTSASAIQLSHDLFKNVDELGTHFNILVLELPEIPTADLSKTPEGLELILPLGDPSNLGAALRSAEAFGVQKVILTQESAHPFLPKSVKASAGSVLRLKMEKGPNLKEIPKSTWALDHSGTQLPQVKWPKNLRLLVGEEGPGLGQSEFEQIVSIPIRGVESLNAVVALSLAVYDYQQRSK